MKLYRDARMWAALSACLVAIAGPVAANYGVSRSTGEATACLDKQACTLAGSETDDAATRAARAITGVGPLSGTFADQRLLTDVTQVGQLPNGLQVYTFKFAWDDEARVGILAQDVLARAETRSAVLQLANGLLGVDYASLGLRMATLAQWKVSGTSALKADYVPARIRQTKVAEPVRLFNRRLNN